MSRLPSFFASPPPSVGVELASDRVTAVSIGRQGSSNTVAGYAVEGLPSGVLTPALNAPNIHDEAAIVTALRSALDKLGSRQRRVALVIPDSAAKVSLLRFEKVPAQSDLDQLIRWQMRKAAPFKPEEAEISWVPAGLLPQGGQEFLVTLARRDVIEGYQRVCAAAGVQAGIVDLASLNLINAVLAGSGSRLPAATGLLVHVTPDYATLAIVRGKDLIFFRTRHLETYSDLTDLVHQTAMYHEDRLGGGSSAASSFRVRRPVAPMPASWPAVASRSVWVFAWRRWISAAAPTWSIASRPAPSCSTRWRPPSASSFESGSRKCFARTFQPDRSTTSAPSTCCSGFLPPSWCW